MSGQNYQFWQKHVWSQNEVKNLSQPVPEIPSWPLWLHILLFVFWDEVPLFEGDRELWFSVFFLVLLVDDGCLGVADLVHDCYDTFKAPEDGRLHRALCGGVSGLLQPLKVEILGSILQKDAQEFSSHLIGFQGDESLSKPSLKISV